MSDRSVGRQVLPALALAILATVLLWWANEQLLDNRLIFGSTFQFPKGRMLLQTGTLVAAGFAFGASVEASHQSPNRFHIGTLAAASLIPLSIVSYFYFGLIFGRFPPLPMSTVTFLTSELATTSSAVALGFLVAAMSVPVLRRIGSSKC